MKKKRIVILGGGISGLSAAFFLSRREDCEISVLEKSGRLGGWIATEKAGDFLFETGPHTFRLEADTFLELVRDLGLEEEVIYADSATKNRYLWCGKKLLKVPGNPVSLLFSPLTRGLIPALFREYRVPALVEEDESVSDFISRRFGSRIAESLIEPWLLGIFAGDIRSLSSNVCLPLFKKLEREYGSVVRGFFKRKKEKKERARLFSFKGGAETIISRLQTKIRGTIVLGEHVEEIRFDQGRVMVRGTTRDWEADEVISSLPPSEMARLLAPLDGETASIFKKIESSSVVSVSLGFNTKLPLPSGFGYLVPSKEKEQISGVLFDSQIFPQQNLHKEISRLTVMMGGAMQKEVEDLSEKECQERAVRAIKKHLQIKVSPSAIRVRKADRALPQFLVGHEKRIDAIEQALGSRFPQLKIVGNYFRGASLGECIRRSKEVCK